MSEGRSTAGNNLKKQHDGQGQPYSVELWSMMIEEIVVVVFVLD